MINGSVVSCLLFVIVCLGTVVVSAQPTLTPQTVDVMENSSAILTCTDPTKTAVSTSWQKGESTSPWANIVLDNGICTTLGFLNRSIYMGNCSGNGVFTVTIMKIDETQHNKTWRCRTGLPDASNDVTVFVKVPVKSVDISIPGSNSMMFKEDKTYSFACKTTYSRPTPSIQWFLQSAGKTDQINATSSDILTQNEKQFLSVKNVLNISFERNQNGGNLFCNGSNGIGVAVTSRKISLNVTFPPDGPPVITGAMNRSTYQIVEHEMAHLSCVVSGGNPLPHIVWICLNGSISEVREPNTVTSKITWTALRNQQNTSCVCVAEHMFGNRNTFVTFDILYKASVLQFYIGEESTVKSSFTVNETELVTFSCNIESKPPPNVTLSHKGNILHVSVSKNRMVYTMENIQCQDFGMYICSARNKYNYGTPSAKNLTMYVYCSPRPFPFFQLIEKVNIPIFTSATLRFSALAFPEPGPSGFTWYYLNGSERIKLTGRHNVAISSSSSQSSLTIINVTQSDYGQYFLNIANSAGDYEQKFSLEPNITTAVSKDVANSSSAVAFVAVGVGTSVATLIIVGSVLFAYRIIRRRRKLLHNVHNDIHETAEDNNEEAGYEQISMKSTEIKASISGKRAWNVSAQQYEKLDESLKERDQYSQLPTLHDHMDVPREKTEGGSIDSSETQQTIKDYINIRI